MSSMGAAVLHSPVLRVLVLLSCPLDVGFLYGKVHLTERSKVYR